MSADASEDRLRRFGDDLASAMAAANVTQEQLMDLLGVSQASISDWTQGKHGPRSPEKTFHLERVLGLDPGSLSRHLGYVPAEVVQVATDVESAIRADPALNAEGKDFLLGAYLMARVEPVRRSRSRKRD